MQIFMKTSENPEKPRLHAVAAHHQHYSRVPFIIEKLLHHLSLFPNFIICNKLKDTGPPAHRHTKRL